MDKQTFFYVGVAVIVGLYVLFGLLKSTLVKTNFSNLNPKSLWAQKPEQLKYLLGGWSDVFLTVINIYLLFTLLAIKETNGEASRNLFRNYDWFLIVGAIALIILIFFVPLRLLFTDPKE
jgi:fumarate reductase subunit C